MLKRGFYLLGSSLLIGLLICVIFWELRPCAMGQQAMEKTLIPRLQLSDATVKQVADWLQQKLDEKGAQVRIIVDPEIRELKQHDFLCGEANGMLWAYSAAASFGCRIEFSSSNLLIITSY